MSFKGSNKEILRNSFNTLISKGSKPILNPDQFHGSKLVLDQSLDQSLNSTKLSKNLEFSIKLEFKTQNICSILFNSIINHPKLCSNVSKSFKRTDNTITN
ncbi:hypothetical protein ACKWTF_000569 [Chironomus riparius]